MNLEERRDKLAQRLAQFVQKGLIKGRGNQKHTRLTARYTNCLAFACLGLTNEQIEEYVCWQYVDRYHCPSPFASFNEKNKMDLLNSIFSFLKKTGLRVAPYNANENLTQNQRKVAVFFSRAFDMQDADKRFLSKDFHFLYQQQDGTWVGKNGLERRVKHFKSLPQTISMQKDNPYVLYGEYVITNPYGTAYPVVSDKIKTRG